MPPKEVDQDEESAESVTHRASTKGGDKGQAEAAQDTSGAIPLEVVIDDRAEEEANELPQEEEMNELPSTEGAAAPATRSHSTEDDEQKTKKRKKKKKSKKKAKKKAEKKRKEEDEGCSRSGEGDGDPREA